MCAVHKVTTRWQCKPVGESDSYSQLYHARSHDCSISVFTPHVRACVRATDAQESTCFLLEVIQLQSLLRKQRRDRGERLSDARTLWARRIFH